MVVYYIKRVNAAGQDFYLRPNGEWAPRFNAGGPTGYVLKTWKTPQGAENEAARLRNAWANRHQAFYVERDEGA